MDQKMNKEEQMAGFSEYTLVNDFVFKGEKIAEAGTVVQCRQSFALHHYIVTNGRNFKIPNTQFFAITGQNELQNAA